MLYRVKREEFDKCYEIMEKSFPRDELRPYKEQRALLEREDYQLWGIGEQIEGVFAVYEWEDAFFIEHFAVSPALRGQGIGGSALQALLVKIGKPAYLEVELPETELARRRIRFYERNGFVFNDYPYMMPALSQGRKPVPLRVMSHGGALSEEAFARVKKKIYAIVYGKNF